MRTIFIYALCEPGTRTVRYIGKALNLKRRLREHLKVSSRSDSHLGRWLRRLKEPPALALLHEASEAGGPEAETRFIRIARSIGMKLVNSTDGGEGVTMTRETRKKISAALKGRPLSARHCQAISESKKGDRNPMFGKPHTLEHSSKVRIAQTGKKHSVAWRAAISAGLKGKTRSPAHCAALSAANKGRKMSREWIEKIAASLRGRRKRLT